MIKKNRIFVVMFQNYVYLILFCMCGFTFMALIYFNLNILIYVV